MELRRNCGGTAVELRWNCGENCGENCSENCSENCAEDCSGTAAKIATHPNIYKAFGNKFPLLRVESFITKNDSIQCYFVYSNSILTSPAGCERKRYLNPGQNSAQGTELNGFGGQIVAHLF